MFCPELIFAVLLELLSWSLSAKSHNPSFIPCVKFLQHSDKLLISIPFCIGGKRVLLILE